MTKLTEIVVAIEAEGVNGVLNALSQVEGAQARVADSSKESANQQIGDNQRAGMSWAQFSTGVNQAMNVVRKAINAGKAVFDFTKEGANLEYVEAKFDNLTESIGTTSDALLQDLKGATRGLVSDADLVTSATDFMSLGLADTHDEVVRLTSVAGALGMNMNQLVLALTNQSTMRFDQLGLSVVGFEEKVRTLEEAGYDVQDAFTEAFLQQAEEQIERVGERADTTAGAFDRLSAAWSNWINNVKQNTIEGGTDESVIARYIEDATFMFERRSTDEENKDIIKYALENGVYDEGDEWRAKASTWAILGTVELRQQWADTAVEIMKSQAAMEDYSQFLMREYGMSAEEARAKTQEIVDTFGVGAISAGDMTEAWASGIEQVGTSAETTKKTLADMYVESLTGATEMSLTYQAMATDWGTMRNMAQGYDQALTQINTNNERLAQLQPFAETGGYLDGVWRTAKSVREEIEALEGSTEAAEAAMERMAAEMTLSLMQASMEIDGYTESEIDSLLDYMIQAGLISETAAEKMRTDYANAIEYANALELDQKIAEILADTTNFEEGLSIVDGRLIDNKTGKILADITDFLDGFTEADLMELDPKVGEVLANILPYLQELFGLPDPEEKTVDIRANYIDGGFIPDVPDSVTIRVNYLESTLQNRAIGGTVYPDEQYNWQEPGREGELLLPQQYGRVMSNTEVALAMREAFNMSQDGDKAQSNKRPEPNRNVSVTVNATVANDFDLDKLTREIVRRINQ